MKSVSQQMANGSRRQDRHSLVEARRAQKSAEREARIKRMRAQAQRLKFLIDHHPIYRGNVSALAADCGIPNQTLHCYVKGTRELKNQEPDWNGMKLAKALGRNVEYIMHGREGASAKAVEKVSQFAAPADRSLIIPLFRSIDIAYLNEIRRGFIPRAEKIMTIQNPETIFGDADIPDYVYGLKSHDGDVSLVEPGNPDERYEDGAYVNVVIPDLNDSIICQVRKIRAADGTFRTVLTQKNGTEIDFHPEAGDTIKGRVWWDLVRRK